MVTFCFLDARERNTECSKISFRHRNAARILRVQSLVAPDVRHALAGRYATTN